MPRLQDRTPAYCRHKASGQARVVLDGRTFYLGSHGTPESRILYDELVARWLANGRRLPEAEPEALTVSEIILRYFRHCERHYAKRRTFESMLSRIKCALRPLKQLFGSTTAAGFGPKSLLLVREQFIDAGLARKTVNDNIQVIKRVFKWAVRDEIVPRDVRHGLEAVEGLRSGESKAKEPRKVLPVPEADVDAVLPHVLPPVRAMVELQRLTGMRPGEAVIMRTVDLDMTGRLWSYRPTFHKGDRRGIDREILLGERAQAILRPFLRANLTEYVFRPDEAERERDAERRRRRKVPLHPSSRRRKPKAVPKRTPGERYTTTTYARAITRACDKAGVPTWTPHRLRHLFATRIRKEHGIEAARVMLGHQHVGVTEIYAERDQAVAASIAAKTG